MFLNLSNLLVIRSSLKTQSLKYNYQRGTGKERRKSIRRLMREEHSEQWQKHLAFWNLLQYFISPFFSLLFPMEGTACVYGCWSVLSINLSVDTPICLSTTVVQWKYVEKYYGEAFKDWRHVVINTEQNIQSLTFKHLTACNNKHGHA